MDRIGPTVEQLLECASAELSDLMLSRAKNPAQTIGHALKLSKLLYAIRKEHDRALWCAQRELEIERFANDSPKNGNAVMRLFATKHEDQ